MTATEALDAFLTPPPRTRELGRETELLARAATSRLRLPASGYARGGGEEISVYRWGVGPAVLLVHGWGSRASHLEAFVTALVEAGRSVVAFDAPGHGRSEGTLTSGPAFSAAIREVAADQKLESFEAIIAHSLGVAALSCALDRGDVKAGKAVLLAGCCRVEPVLVRFATKLDLPAEIQAELLRISTAEFPAREVCADLLAPNFGGISALLMHDPEDAEMPFEHSRQLAAAWPGATLLETPGVGHFRILRAREIVKRTLEHALPQSAPA